LENLQLKGSMAAWLQQLLQSTKVAHIVRTHDVPETADVVKFSGAIRSRRQV